MQVIHINDKLEVSGGVEVYIRDALPALKLRGIDAHWVAVRRNGAEVDVASTNALWNWRGPLSEFTQSPMAQSVGKNTVFHVNSLSEPTILQKFFELGPVVRHMHEPRLVCPGQGKFWAKSESACTTPFGLHCLGHAYTQRCCNRHPKRLLRQFQNTRFEVNQAANQYSALIANSGYIKAEALKVGYAEDKIHVVPYFTEITPEPDWDMKQSPVITFAGRLSRTKGVHYLLDAFSQVIRTIPDAKLEILGAGQDEAVFQKQADDLGLSNAVKFHGWVDKATIDACVARATVVAFPSIYPEAFGITGIEAMMRGKPVVAFDVGGVTDWLSHEETGLLATRIGAEELASALLRLVNDATLTRHLGRQARSVALSKFSTAPHMAEMMQLYEVALNDRYGTV
jgi:glycosyltransferase involved in cell wall biosynthesis